MRLVLGILIGSVLLYAAVVAFFYARQRTILFLPFGEPVTAAAAGLQGFEDLLIETPDGERLAAWYRAPKPGRPMIVYFHGNAGSLLLRRDRARALTDAGAGLLLFAYRGFPGSTGTPSEAGLRRDAAAVYGFVSRRFPPSRIVLYGESLGTGVATPLAAERPVGGLVLDAPFTSAADVAKRVFPFLPVDLLMTDPFRSIAAAPGVKSPSLVLHGERDPVVPFDLGERLFAALPEPKRFVRLPGGHEENLSGEGLRAVLAFLDEVEARSPAIPLAPAGDAKP